MAVVSDSRDIDAAVAYMLIATVRVRASIGGIFISLQAFLAKGVEDGLVLRLERDRFHSVPSMMPHSRVGVVAAFCLN